MTSELTFPEKIKQLTEELHKQAEPYHLKGDDRVLSQLTTQFSVKVENLVKDEIKNIQDSQETSDNKKLKLVKLREQVRDISWLPKGFKSSLNVQLVFASAKIS